VEGWRVEDYRPTKMGHRARRVSERSMSNELIGPIFGLQVRVPLSGAWALAARP
jgi:hypothetical protein